MGPETGFLDLPKELRDMVYNEICSELKRQGLRWEATAPRTREIDESKINKIMDTVVTEELYSADAPIKRPTVFADCAIMRTCRQIHSEFATVLYSQPLQLCYVRKYLNEIPLPPLYAHLVRTILVVRSSLYKPDCDDLWRQQLHIVSDLNRLFPKADTLRLGWWIRSYLDEDPVALVQKNPAAWIPVAELVETSIKRVEGRTSAGTLRGIPHNLEVVQIRETRSGERHFPKQYSEVESMPTPITEVIRKLRGKQPLRRGLRTRKA